MEVRLTNRLRRRGAIAAALASLAISGCATGTPFMVSESGGGKPLVWDCAMVQMSSPPKFGCPDGKTYTAFQLRDFREAAEKQAGIIASK
jgi:hypothetical protein